MAEDAYSEPHISENNFKCYCVVGPSGCSDYRNSDGSVVVQTVRLYLWIDVSSIYAGELNTLAVFQCFMFLKFCALTYWPLEQLGVECLAQGHLDSSWWGGESVLIHIPQAHLPSLARDLLHFYEKLE